MEPDLKQIDWRKNGCEDEAGEKEAEDKDGDEEDEYEDEDEEDEEEDEDEEEGPPSEPKPRRHFFFHIWKQTCKICFTELKIPFLSIFLFHNSQFNYLLNLRISYLDFVFRA